MLCKRLLPSPWYRVSKTTPQPRDRVSTTSTSSRPDETYQKRKMEVVAAGVAWALNQAPSTQKILTRLGLSCLATQSAVPWSDLSAQLSSQASIVLPEESAFEGQISRWREWHAPDVGAVVNVFTESDVQATVSRFHTLPRHDAEERLHRSVSQMSAGCPFWLGRAATAPLSRCKLRRVSSLWT